MSTFNITTSALENKFSPVQEWHPAFRKWDVIQTASSGQKGIIIRVKSNFSMGVFPPLRPSHTFTVYPYKTFKYKWMQWVWFKVLKLRVWIGDFYKK